MQRAGASLRRFFLKNFPSSSRKSVLALAAWAGAGCALPVCGQVAQPLPDTLRTAEVRAGGLREGVSSPVSVQRISADGFRALGITDTGDALRRLAGVNLRDYGGAGGLKTVSVRGLGAAHTAVSYDGLAVTDAQQGQIDLRRFSLDALESVSLQTLDNVQLLCPVRNLAAALVELNALRPDSVRRGWHGRAALRQAAFGVYNPAFSLSRSAGRRVEAGFSADYFFGRNDYPFFIDNGVASTTERRRNSRMQGVTAEADVRVLTPRGGSVTAKAHFYHNYRRLPGAVVLYASDNDERLTERQTFGQATWRQRYGRWELMAAAKYSDQTTRYADYDEQYPGGMLRYRYGQHEMYATAGASCHVFPWLQVAYATDAARAAFTSNQAGMPEVTRRTWLQSLSAEVGTETLRIVARGVWHRLTDHRHASELPADERMSRLVPSLTASWRVVRRPVWVFLRAGCKESFRAPTFSEAYYYHSGPLLIRPERVRQLSLGATLQARPAPWWPLLALTADAYANRINDRITSIPVNLFIWRTLNLGRVRAEGVDLTAESRWVAARHHELALRANYSWLQTCDVSDPSLMAYRRQLAYTPKHSGAASLAYTNPWVNAVAHVSFASARWTTNEHLQGTRLAAWQEWGFALYRSFRLRRTELEARADLLNAFGARYEVIRRYPMPGRAYKLALTLRW